MRAKHQDQNFKEAYLDRQNIISKWYIRGIKKDFKDKICKKFFRLYQNKKNTRE